MVAQQSHQIVEVPLSEVSDKVRTVPGDHSLVKQARSMGTCFGDRLCVSRN